MLRSELGEAEPAERGRARAGGAAGAAAASRRDRRGGRARRRCWTVASTGVRRAAGRGYPDLVRLRTGRLEDAPDAVVLPGSVAEVERVLEICCARGHRRGAVRRWHERRRRGRARCAGGFERLISLDLRRLRDVERRSALADGDAGPRAARSGGRGGARRRRGSRWATSRSRSSTRRSAASPPPARPGRRRAATAASTSWSRRSASPRRQASCERSRPRTAPPARRCASWSSAPRGRWG